MERGTTMRCRLCLVGCKTTNRVRLDGVRLLYSVWDPRGRVSWKGDEMSISYVRRLAIGLPVALTLVVVLIAAFMVVAATADAAPVRERVSGNFIDTAIDTNGDGIAANSVSGAVRGDLGPTYEGVWEIAFLPPSGACPVGNAEGEVVAYSIVRRYFNGDLQYSALDASKGGFLCFDLATGEAKLVINAEFTGGTGRFEDSAGTYKADFDVTLLLPDLTGGIAHGAFTGNVQGDTD